MPTPTPATRHPTDLDEVRSVGAQQLAVQRLAATDLAAPGYKAGPLTGIFATAPFLHNGSVPTLDALPPPPDQSPIRFAMGQVLFDPEKVGFGAAIGGGR